jgi:hypothetical protein
MTFPYGADATNPNSFLGLFNQPSRTWYVSYVAGFSIVAGYHSFIFLGLENLVIAKVYLRGAGVNANVGARRLGSTPRRQEALDALEEAVNNGDAASDYFGLNEASSAAVSLYREMMENTVPTLVTARSPFSLLDVSQAWGMVEGFNADVVLAGAQVYWLTMHNRFRFLNSDRVYMERQRVANLDDGSIGLGIGSMFGQFSVEESHSLYHAFGQSRDPLDRPYRIIPNVTPFIAELPPARSLAPVPPAALGRLSIRSMAPAAD